MSHLCHAEGCAVDVPPRLLMCARHWRLVSPETQRAVWNEYRRGQEIDKRPTQRYLAVQARAISEVAFLALDEVAAKLAARWAVFAEIARRKAIDTGAGDPLEYTGKPSRLTGDQADKLAAVFMKG